MAGRAAAWFSPPSPGDIVWCRFPQRGIPGPGPKSRPALVTSVGEIGGQPTAFVAYGTSQNIDRLFPGEFTIASTEHSAFDAAGLTRSTKFDLARLFELDYNDRWFAIAPGTPHGQTPQLGILHPSLMRRAKATYDAATRSTSRDRR
ncbi:MAG: type II toxin-antitoxin system PemK/MazF family toxin [Betaproteobacteria bacterium]